MIGWRVLTSAVRKVALYWNTLRFLRWTQITGRLLFVLKRPKVDTSPAPPVRARTGMWTPGARRQPSLVSPTVFRLLNTEGNLAEIGWDGPLRTKLWRYNQHYFDDLNASESHLRLGWHQALVERWVNDNPPGVGVGWEPYPCSLRVVNWLKWQLAGNKLSGLAIHSLSIQARWLNERLEWHLLGNHLLANAKALIFVGTFFEGEEAEAWKSQGLAILCEQLREQILSDGGHFERSAMYHALVLEDVLDLICLGRAYPDAIPRSIVSDCEEVAGRMVTWLRSMVHPDGEIAFFNDAAIGVAPAPGQLFSYSAQLELTERGHGASSAASGYARLEHGSAIALLDVGSVGPDYLPGHAHAGTLSFELSVAGRRIIVNTGTSEYGLGDIRAYERSTTAHSTVQVGGESSSEVWAGFRVARRARVSALAQSRDFGSTTLSCCHDGYQRLGGGPTHCRTWRLTAGELRISDHVKPAVQQCVARFHLHPDVVPTVVSPGLWQVSLSGIGAVAYVRIETGHAHLEAGHYSPQFGVRQDNSCLAVELDGGRADVVVTFAIDSKV